MSDGPVETGEQAVVTSIDETIPPPPEGRELIDTETGFTRAMMSPSQAKAEWESYLAVCELILGPGDYSKIGNKQYKRKSGWRKLAKVFSVSDVIVDRVIERDGHGRPTFAAVEVRATDRWGRSTIGYHEAHLSEKCCPTIYGEPCPKSQYDNHICCRADCSGYVHWSLPGNMPATAHTRAKNRAIADLIGAGEVSAEEMEAVGVEGPAPHRGKGRQPPAKTPPRPRAKSKAALEAEAKVIREGSAPANGDKPWRCGKCKDERPIPAVVKDCPYCGHRRGAAIKTDTPATPAQEAAAGEKLPQAESEESKADGGPTKLTEDELKAEHDALDSAARGEVAEEAEAQAAAEAGAGMDPPAATE